MGDLRAKLSEEAFRVTQNKGTEIAFSGKFVHHNEKGIYVCVVCGSHLFESNTKFDSKTGWPSFTEALPDSVKLLQDNSHDMNRTEVTCASCNAHLGHVFPDGPLKNDNGNTFSGNRFCINSVALNFKNNIPNS